MSLLPCTRAIPPFPDRRIEASIKLIEYGLERGVKVCEIATRVGLSRSRFGHLFKVQTGTTFRLYVREMRLARAKALLRDLSLRVEEVAWRCGYAQTSTLDHEFESAFGISPSDYRRSNSDQQIASQTNETPLTSRK